MCDERRALLEILPAVRALVWCFPSVDPLVSDKSRALKEAFPTVGALVGFLSRVSSLMFNEG